MTVVFCTDPALVDTPGFYRADANGQILPGELVEAHDPTPNTTLGAQMVVSTGFNKE